mmetsp:Transcript_4314/g.10530  ORF Transcript_4314/g.10530 Transcript_4314/m.10530 type:complete len:285 (+) Transcript_4314:214-1068(+)|eukprot:CAMPEP_0178983406 /NCGR_PEP_ID=MMETSP0795-20121207/1041_1 /TAXON_ID=88552 /ORGANISM="Amoebophrya sp., Strain Ameob2" /LENGTH=284 /DNA_ID=CAMNT_0020674173 /DNA_START=99 /DNA_END=953 /DNA_ORIENTATION=-
MQQPDKREHQGPPAPERPREQAVGAVSVEMTGIVSTLLQTEPGVEQAMGETETEQGGPARDFKQREHDKQGYERRATAVPMTLVGAPIVVSPPGGPSFESETASAADIMVEGSHRMPKGGGGKGGGWQGGGPVPAAQNYLEWDRMEIEFSCPCFLACCCPCVSLQNIANTAGMQSCAPILVGVMIAFRYCCGSWGPHYVHMSMVYWWYGAWHYAIWGWCLSLLSFGAWIGVMVVELMFKQKLGNHLGVWNAGQITCEDVVCMFCCACCWITAMERTAEKAWARW